MPHDAITLAPDRASLEPSVLSSTVATPTGRDARTVRRVGAVLLGPVALLAGWQLVVWLAPGASVVSPSDVARAATAAFGPVRPPAEGEDGVVLLSNGPPIADCRVAILRDGGFVGEDEIGEICVSAPFMFSGYYRNEAATEAAMHEGWYRTGDIGFLNQGEVFVVGRVKDACATVAPARAFIRVDLPTPVPPMSMTTSNGRSTSRESAFRLKSSAKPSISARCTSDTG